MNAITLEDQTAVVTGAGRGIGRAHALLLAARGAAVVVNDVAVEPDGMLRADKVVAEITAQGGRAISSTHDVGSEVAARELIEQAVQEYGRLDILVHNAGLTAWALAEQALVPGEGFWDTDLAVVRRHIEVQLLGSYYLGQPAWRHMADRGYGRIVLTSSGAVFGYPGDGAYGAAKMGLVALVRTMDMEAKRMGVDIKTNALSPAADTGPAGEQDQVQARFGGRLTPENVAGPLVWLVSPECQMSGECFRVGGSYVGRVFLGMTRGWVSTHSPIRPEDVRDHLPEVTALDGYVIPDDYLAVLDFMCDRVTETNG
jgi:NAD(P)-dependent dehydrogenase (short-subunit alcohol dehydrogenase family)